MAKPTKEQKRKAKLKAKKQLWKSFANLSCRNILMTPEVRILPDGVLSGKWE